MGATKQILGVDARTEAWAPMVAIDLATHSLCFFPGHYHHCGSTIADNGGVARGGDSTFLENQVSA